LDRSYTNNSEPSIIASSGKHQQTASDTKYTSKDATTCVEIVPSGFKCKEVSGVKRWITNILLTKSL